jgi:putative intracellular protease/amidase
MNRLEVGIVVYEAVEVLDFCGPFEVFSLTRLNEEKRREEPSPFNVFLIAEATSPVVATGGMKVVPDYDLDTCPQLDILIVPGGWGAMREMNNERLVNWIGRRSTQVEMVTSVCTGPCCLAKPGCLTANVLLRIGVFLIGCRSSFQELLSRDKYISWRKGASSPPRASLPALTCP